jgi:hypothetical protein
MDVVKRKPQRDTKSCQFAIGSFHRILRNIAFKRFYWSEREKKYRIHTLSGLRPEIQNRPDTLEGSRQQQEYLCLPPLS